MVTSEMSDENRGLRVEPPEKSFPLHAEDAAELAAKNFFS